MVKKSKRDGEGAGVEISRGISVMAAVAPVLLCEVHLWRTCEVL